MQTRGAGIRGLEGERADCPETERAHRCGQGMGHPSRVGLGGEPGQVAKGILGVLGEVRPTSKESKQPPKLSSEEHQTSQSAARLPSPRPGSERAKPSALPDLVLGTEHNCVGGGNSESSVRLR